MSVCLKKACVNNEQIFKESNMRYAISLPG